MGTRGLCPHELIYVVQLARSARGGPHNPMVGEREKPSFAGAPFPRIPGRDQRWRPSTGPEAVQVRDGKAQVPHHDLATPVAGSTPTVTITGKVSPRLATHLRRRSACQ